MQSYDHVIIGNCAAGISAIEAIRSAEPDSAICVISDEDSPAYSRPLISHLLDGSVREEEMSLRPDGFYDSMRCDTYLGHQATRIDAEKHQVTLKGNKKIGYGDLCVASGSVPFRPKIEGLDSCKQVFTFLGLSETKRLMSFTDSFTSRHGRPPKVVVLGSGLIGVKAAEALCRRGCKVEIADHGQSILHHVLDEYASEHAQKVFSRHGVECLCGRSVTALEVKGGRLTCVLCEGGERLEADCMVLAVGVRPNTALLKAAGADVENGVICDESMRTSLPDVYAAGDCVATHGLLDGTMRPLAIWPNAVTQGRVAGHSMAHVVDGYDGGFAMNAVDLFGNSYLSAGLFNPPAGAGFDRRSFCNDSEEGGGLFGSYASFVSKDNRLLGFVLVNRPERAGIYRMLIADKVPLNGLGPHAFDEAGNAGVFDLDAQARFELLCKGAPKALREDHERRVREAADELLLEQS